MKSKIIPNKEVEIKVYSLYYTTGDLYLKSKDNSNVGINSKKIGAVATNVFMVPAYTYEEAVTLLHESLLKFKDLFTKDVVIKAYAVLELNELFNWAFSMHGVDDFKEEVEKDNEVTGDEEQKDT